MPQYQLRFTIPQQRQGEREIYKSFALTLRKLQQLVGKEKSGTFISNLEVAGGSIRGRADIEARSYSEALEFCCQNAPIIDLEWHLEEKMATGDLERILAQSLK